MNRFKTEPMAHQLEALRQLTNKRAYGLLMEQGTGKTKVCIDDQVRLYYDNIIDRALVVAPNNVHFNWIDQEIPKHWPEQADLYSFAYEKGLDWQRPISGQMTICAISYDSLITKHGAAFAQAFLSSNKSMMVLDESHYAKNPTAARTKAILNLRKQTAVRRILTGTAIANSPFDLYSQFSFLDPAILRTSSYFAFKAEYAEMLPASHGLIQKLRPGVQPGGRVPQIVAKTPEGEPKYKNLEKLQRLIAPHSFRVLKKDCLDLPEKVYSVLPFELSRRQRKLYDDFRERLRSDFFGDMMTLESKLIAYGKLQQITSGYMIHNGSVIPLFDKPTDNPRLKCLLEFLDDNHEPTIIWAKYIEEINALMEVLPNAARYDGSTLQGDRRRIVEDFQGGKYQYIVANPAAGATGITLTRAERSIYYSNSFNLVHRQQSEDRNHRIGTKGNVLYFDLVARDTIDEKIARSLQMKKEIAMTINGDDL